MDERVLIVSEKNQGQRLDKFIANMNKDLSRSYIQDLIDDEQVMVNEKIEKKSYRVETEDKIRFKIPPAAEPKIDPVSMKLEIIYEDNDILAINKPAGLLVHPAPNTEEESLVNGLLAYCDDLSGIGGMKRPGIVHRLDKDTSGIIVVAKNDLAHRKLVEQFKEREIKKTYRTIVCGQLKYSSGKIKAPIGRNPDNRTEMAVVERNSKRAVSYFKLLEKFQEYSYLEVYPRTGRTHQIRVHLAYMGNPVLGDTKYGEQNNEFGVKRQLLHAYKLVLTHPITGEEMEFTAPLPDDFLQILKRLQQEASIK